MKKNRFESIRMQDGSWIVRNTWTWEEDSSHERRSDAWARARELNDPEPWDWDEVREQMRKDAEEHGPIVLRKAY